MDEAMYKITHVMDIIQKLDIQSTKRNINIIAESLNCLAEAHNIIAAELAKTLEKKEENQNGTDS